MFKLSSVALPLALLLFASLAGCEESEGPPVQIGTPEITTPFAESDCRAELTFPLRVAGADPPESLWMIISLDEGADGTVDDDLPPGAVLTGSAPEFALTYSFPLGENELLVDAWDAQGSLGSAATVFEVVDTRAPSPVCINGLAIELMPTEPGTDADGDGDLDAGAMAIWATDFVASPASDCSEPITYSIRRALAPADIEQTGLTLTCDDLGQVQVDVLAWDDARNFDYCESYVLVQDNMASCTD